MASTTANRAVPLARCAAEPARGVADARQRPRRPRGRAGAARARTRRGSSARTSRSATPRRWAPSGEDAPVARRHRRARLDRAARRAAAAAATALAPTRNPRRSRRRPSRRLRRDRGRRGRRRRRPPRRRRTRLSLEPARGSSLVRGDAGVRRRLDVDVRPLRRASHGARGPPTAGPVTESAAAAPRCGRRSRSRSFRTSSGWLRGRKIFRAPRRRRARGRLVLKRSSTASTTPWCATVI